MYAVVEAGGRQYQLIAGRYVDVDMVAGEPKSTFTFDQVVMIVNGDQSYIGKPLVEGAKVTGKIINHVRRSKIVVYKYRPKKGTRKRTGHRQGFTRIYIDSISLKDQVLSAAQDQSQPERKDVAQSVQAPSGTELKSTKNASEEAARPAKSVSKKSSKAEVPAKPTKESAGEKTDLKNKS